MLEFQVWELFWGFLFVIRGWDSGLGFRFWIQIWVLDWNSGFILGFRFKNQICDSFWRFRFGIRVWHSGLGFIFSIQVGY